MHVNATRCNQSMWCGQSIRNLVLQESLCRNAVSPTNYHTDEGWLWITNLSCTFDSGKNAAGAKCIGEIVNRAGSKG